MSVDAREAVRQLKTKWRLSVRAVVASSADEDTEPAAVALRRRKTMAYRYLHRAVSHFYRCIGNKAVSDFFYVRERGKEPRQAEQHARYPNEVRGCCLAWRGARHALGRRVYY